MSSPLRIQLTSGAEDDLQALYDIRLSQRGADGADGADAMLEALYTAMSALADFPLMGPIPPELAQLGMADWRQISVWPWRIIYTVAGDTVTIAVIADSRRDFATLLERRLLRRSL
jgi:toxin ParE1/3/4